MEMTGCAVLVTGGTSGLGLGVARRMLAVGARVVVTGRDPERGEKAAADLGAGAYFVPGDVGSPADVQAALEAATALGRLAAAVNCAGIARSGLVLGRRGPLPLEEFQDMVAVNLVGTFNVVRLAAQTMSGYEPVGEERGVVVCTSSIAAYDGQRGQSAYAASKAGVCGMTLPLARDLARHAIRVVTIAPGLFESPLFETLPEEQRQALVADTPHPKRLGRPDEFAALVEHVVRNPMVNGEVIRIDAGVRLGG
jgi:NAD(P)-dependent dehydrogenase (short-subunit alcohol dehydrogenase family)